VCAPHDDCRLGHIATQKFIPMSALSTRPATSDDLQRVVGHILDLGAMTEAIASILDKDMTGFANEMLEIESHFPGFTKRLRRRIGQEVRRTISLRVPGLRRDFESFLGSRLTSDDVKAALQFQRHQISMQLRDPAFARLLETEDHGDVGLSERMFARMSPEQHAFVTNFLQSPCGVKLAPLARQMESLKYDWMQAIARDVSQSLPTMGNEILNKHYIRPTRSP